MKRRLKVIALTMLFGVLGATALAQTDGLYNLTWNTFDGGGATFSTGGSYTLGGTAGQADAGAMTGGAYALQGGFWSPPGYLVYVSTVHKP
ncbi:MAG: hypothetical protein K6U78_08175 [Anaerolineae bacterium]|nr:hypothetical protein [Anaerolineae bacterium]